MSQFNAAILWSDSADVMDFSWISFPSQMIDDIIKCSAEAMPNKKVISDDEF